VSDTAVAVATKITKNSARLETSLPTKSLVAAGEEIMLYDGFNDYEHIYTVEVLETGYRMKLASVFKDVLDAQLDQMTMHRRRKVRVAHDASESDMKYALESLPGVGSVDVSRFGPDKNDAYTWSITFDSLNGASLCSSSKTPCLVAEPTTVRFLEVQNCNQDKLYGRMTNRLDTPNGVYLELNMTNGRPLFGKISTDTTYDGANYMNFESGYYIRYDLGSDPGYKIIEQLTGRAERIVSNTSEYTTSASMYQNMLKFSSNCEVVLRNTTLTTLQGKAAKVVPTVVTKGIAADFDAIAASAKVSGSTAEVQTITVSASADNIDGAFTAGFACKDNVQTACADIVTIKYDMTAKDVKAKLESLSTVGIVDVSREEYSYGYKWAVTFKTNLGDIPLMLLDASPTAGFELEGTDISLTIEETVKGSFGSLVNIGADLETGRKYAARVAATNSMGQGPYTTEDQSTGTGMVPMQVTTATSPGAPVVGTVKQLSASSVRFNFTAPASNGLPIEAYKVEWTTDSDFGTNEVLDFRIMSDVAEDTWGTFTITLGGETTTPLLYRGITAQDVEDAIVALTTVAGATVTQTAFEGVYPPGSALTRYGYEWSVTFTQDVRNLGKDARYTSVDLNGLNSVCLCSNITQTYDNITANVERILPANYGSDLVYATPACGSTVYGKESPYQVMSISESAHLLKGSFQLSLDGDFTTCVPFDADAYTIEAALEALTDVYNVSVRQPRVNAANNTGLPDISEFWIRFEGEYPTGSWPTLRAHLSNETKPCGIWEGKIDGWKTVDGTSEMSLDDVYVTVTPLLEEMPCSAGNTEVRAIVAEATSPLGGSFRVSIAGAAVSISLDASAAEVEAAIESLDGVGDVQVTK
jgi:hypothetical protein